MFSFLYDAKANIIGSPKYPNIHGTFLFRETKNGILITAKIYGLPTYYKFLTNRFKIKEILYRSIILHDMPDDFTTQPSGNSGNKIACGIITK